jgi:hypothetical protein
MWRFNGLGGLTQVVSQQEEEGYVDDHKGEWRSSVQASHATDGGLEGCSTGH